MRSTKHWSQCAANLPRLGRGRLVVIIGQHAASWALVRVLIAILFLAPLSANALNVAFHYGQQAPLDAMRTFDVVVVEPSHRHDPRSHGARNAQASVLYAYVSIGEVAPSREYIKQMPKDMFAGKNNVWNSRVINQAHPDWPTFFVDRIVAPLWQEGYRGLFLDTMDSYQAISRDATLVRQQQDGLVRAIALLRARFPNIKLIANRGFELLPRIAQHLQGVAAESLFGRWDQENGRYVDVPENDRQWLLARFNEVKSYGLAAISIDYAEPADRQRVRDIATKIDQEGIVPFVTSGDLMSVGVGLLEPMPRRVLLIHNTTAPDGIEQDSAASRIVTMPLQYLGFRVDALDLDVYSLPSSSLADRYAAVVALFNRDDPTQAGDLTRFLTRAVDERVPVVFLNSFGVPRDGELTKKLGLIGIESMRAPVRITHLASKGVGDEIRPLPTTKSVLVRATGDIEPLLSVTGAADQQADAIAITDWGGYAVSPYTYVPVSDDGKHRWAFDPILFFRKAIGRKHDLIAPDVTTENGRRLLMVHIDGDGFASRAEIPGAPWAAHVMYRDFIKRYRVPHTVSVIEGETGSDGLYPQFSDDLERIARRIFKLEHVEIASHSYSHPFYWGSVVSAAQRGEESSVAESLQHLPIEGYNFDLHRDIVGSANYINSRLAPPGKKTKVFLWTGDCAPPAVALKQVSDAGLLNMNAGDTMMTRENPSLTAVAPLSIRKSGRLQVFAPNQNENVYTNNWTGPFYGFDRVIETFKLTNSPRRLKPINIYYHTYSASKSASIAALHRVYRYALSQPINPVFASDYIEKVQDFETLAISRELNRSTDDQQVWRVAGAGNLRTLRVPDSFAQRINWQKSSGLAGRKKGVDGTYLHLSGPRARLVVDREAQEWSTYVMAANGRIDAFERSHTGFQFQFTSQTRGRLTVVHGPQCRVLAGNKQLRRMKASSGDGDARFIHNYRTRRDNARKSTLISVRC